MTARLYMLCIAWAAGIAILVGAYVTVERIGYQRCEGEHAIADDKAKDKAAVEVDRRAKASANAGMNMLDYLAAQKPAIEIRIHEKVNQTRKAYQDNPLPDGCVRPASVRPGLDAARDAANSAAGGMRPEPSGPVAPHP